LGTSQAHGRFLINSDVYPGDSGAPVFVNNTGSRPDLVGMIIQRVSPKASDFSHFAVAVDADVIRETLALVEASENHMAPAVPSPSPKPAH
jgi:V8-like Glu-specific endopeptidase